VTIELLMFSLRQLNNTGNPLLPLCIKAFLSIPVEEQNSHKYMIATRYILPFALTRSSISLVE
jgi:hypothetical protein